MRSKLILLLSLLLLFSCAACVAQDPQEQPEGQETLLADGDSGGLEEEPAPAFDPVVPAGQAVDPQWFSDAAFVGDSVSVMLENYNTSTSVLGSPAFF